ncbi:hypothetical protein KAI32_04155 [Candidatus Pacearchaeota archaeon]|nr:hypothetical protein [Candidatus Pacearchaeota archaeon]
MDKLHIALIVLLGISIVFLGIGLLKSPVITDASGNVIKEEPEVWSGDITPDDINNIADHDWIARLKITDGSKMEGSEKVCLNICGIRCLWLGYPYKSHTVKPGSFLWGDKENAICGCECYVIKE